MALTEVNSKGIKDADIATGDIADGAITTAKLAAAPAILTGSTNNTVATVTGANAITGEANLTFNGSKLAVTGDVDVTDAIAEVTVKSTDASAAKLFLNGHGATAADFGLGHIGGQWNGNDVANIRLESGDDTTNKDDGRITFNVSASSSSPAEAMRIDPNKNVKISSKLTVTHNDWDTVRVENTNADANGAYLDLVKNSSSPADGDETGVIRFRADDDAGNEHTFAVIRGTSPDVSNGAENGQIEFQTSSGGTVAERLRITQSGNLKILDGDLQINTAGHGIDFSSHGNAGGMTAELLDDYEEGNFTPTVAGTSGTGTPAYASNSQHGKYTKIGRLVSAVFDINVSSWSGASGNLQIILPFASASFATNTYFYYTAIWHAIDSNFIGSTGNYRAGYMAASSTGLMPRVIGDSNNDSGMNVNTTGRIAGSITYITDS